MQSWSRFATTPDSETGQLQEFKQKLTAEQLVRPKAKPKPSNFSSSELERREDNVARQVMWDVSNTQFLAFSCDPRLDLDISDVTVFIWTRTNPRDLVRHPQ